MTHIGDWTQDEVESVLGNELKHDNLTIKDLYDMQHIIDIDKAEENEYPNIYNEIITKRVRGDLESLSPEELEQLLSMVDNHLGASNEKDALISRIKEQQAKINEAEQASTLDSVVDEAVAAASEGESNDTSVSSGEAAPDRDELDDSQRETLQDSLKAIKRDVDGLKPSELLELRKNLDDLYNHVSNEEIAKARADLEVSTIRRIKDFADDKLIIVDMDEVYALDNLLDSIQQDPKSEISQEESNFLQTAKTKTYEEIIAFEEEYGIANLQDAESFQHGVDMLDALPTDKELFGYEGVATSNNDVWNKDQVLEFLTPELGKEEFPDLGKYVAAWRCPDLTDEEREELRDTTANMLKTHFQKGGLTRNEAGDFRFLVDELSKNNVFSQRVLENFKQTEAHALQMRAREESKDYWDIHLLLSNYMKIQGAPTLLGRPTISQEGPDSDLALFLQQVRRETEIYLAANTDKDTPPEVFQKLFRQEYADRIRKELLTLVAADATTKGRLSSKELKSQFSKLLSASKKNPIVINRDTLIGWQAAKNLRAESAVNRISDRPGFNNAGKTLWERIKATDAKFTKKYKLYSNTKNILKSAGWGAAYGFAGATLGPVGIAAVSTASFATKAWGFYKGYKAEAAKAREKGQKINLWSYMKNNKMQTASLALGLASAATAGLISAEMLTNPATIKAVTLAKSASGITLALSGMTHGISMAYKQTPGSERDKLKASIKAGFSSLAAFGAGLLAGQAAGQAAAGMYDRFTTPDAGLSNTPDINTVEANTVDANTPTAATPQMQAGVQGASAQAGIDPNAMQSPEGYTNTVDSIMDNVRNGNMAEPQMQSGVEGTSAPTGIDPNAYRNPVDQMMADIGLNGSENVDTPQNYVELPQSSDVQDVNGIVGGGISDTVAVDLNNLSQEQQHDLKMLFLRDPAEANQILGQEGSEWMNSRQLQEAWDNGTITDEQKIQLTEFAGQRFDDQGNFVGDDAQKMEAAAREWSARHAAPQETAPTQPQSVETPAAPENDPAPKMEPVLTDPAIHDINKDLGGVKPLSPEDVSLMANPQQADTNGIDVNKIKIDENGNVKIVAHTDEGRTVVHTEVGDNSGFEKIKYQQNGDITFRLETESGHEVKATINEQGQYTDIQSGSHYYSREELDYINAKPEVIEQNQARYSALQDLKDAAAQKVAQETQVTPETSATQTDTNGIDTNKIKINENGDVKIVAHTDEGRTVVHTEVSDNSGIDKVKYQQNGDISFRLETESGNEVKATINEQGQYTNLQSGSHYYSREELDYINAKSDVVEQNQARYSALQDLKDAATQKVAQETQATTETSATPAVQSNDQSSIVQERSDHVRMRMGHGAGAQQASTAETPAKGTTVRPSFHTSIRTELMNSRSGRG